MALAQSALAKFADKTDLLYCLGDQIQSRALLNALCQSSKRFNKIFTPFLYREVHLERPTVSRVDGHSNHPEESNRWGAILESPGLAQTLRFTIQDTSSWESTLYSDDVCELIKRMPRLTHFNSPNSRMLESIASTLRNHCPDIKTINVSQIDQPRFLKGTSLFINLREFNYLNLRGNLVKERARIVQVLVNSPRLEHLGLSIRFSAFNELPWEQYSLFFRELCNDYHKEGGLPLLLKSLYLGDFTFPTCRASFPKLTDVSCIEQIHIENDSHWFLCETQWILGVPPIAFDIFEPENCPRLRRFTANYNSEELFCFLHKFTRPLAVFLDTTHQEDPEATDMLLRTFDKDTGRAIPTTMAHLQLGVRRFHQRMIYWDFSSAEKTISLLTSPRQQPLEGLSVELPWIGDDFDEVDVDNEAWEMLKTVICQLGSLTQLAVCTIAHERVFPSGSTWNPQYDVELQALAEELAEAAPQLRYINVRCGYWKICPQANGERILERLERHEITRVELFHGHPASGRNTLPYNSA